MNKISTIRAVRLTIAALLFMALAGCNDALKAVAQAENAIPQAVTLISNTTTQLLQQDAITVDEAKKVSALLTDIENADHRAIAATKTIATLDPAAKATIAQIVTPIIAEVQASINTGDVFQIKNANAKLTITTALVALTTTLQIIEARTK